MEINGFEIGQIIKGPLSVFVGGPNTFFYAFDDLSAKLEGHRELIPCSQMSITYSQRQLRRYLEAELIVTIFSG